MEGKGIEEQQPAVLVWLNCGSFQTSLQSGQAVSFLDYKKEEKVQQIRSRQSSMDNIPNSFLWRDQAGVT